MDSKKMLRLISRSARISILALACVAISEGIEAMDTNDASIGYDELVSLFQEFRAFEQPPLKNGAPDYSAERMTKVDEGLADFRQRLETIDTKDWSIPEKVDWHLLRAEINGLDFHVNVLRPWTRDPAFYQSVWTDQSDTPAHEGPAHHALLELWTYEFPLSASEQQRLGGDLRVIPPLLAQARVNLTGNARDLWISGTQNLRQQVIDLRDLKAMLGDRASEQLTADLDRAIRATMDFVDWLDGQAAGKTGPSGVGIDAYNWHLQQVWYVPMSWEDEQRLLERELHRAWSSLKLEEQRNRDLPEPVAAADPESYDRLADASAARLMRFLEEQEILAVEPWMEPALRAHLGEFIPEKERNFFTIGAHYDPTPLYTHFYHWFDLARMREQPHPSPLRREPMRFNIFTSRAEGMATGFEEMTLHAGLHDRHPRAREIVWILLAQRAARGLGSLDAHANFKTMSEAAAFHARWTPRQWMRRDLEELDEQFEAAAGEMNLLAFEQQLYLRQPGYGTSYVTGKYQIEQLLSVYARQRMERDEEMVLADFMAEFNDAGMIPVALIHWQMTGDSAPVDRIMQAAVESPRPPGAGGE